METSCQSSSQKALWKDVEVGKEKMSRYLRYQLGALTLGLVLVSLSICVFSLKYVWSSSPGKVYSHEYKVALDGVETDSVMEIDPAHGTEVFRMGNSSDEVIEVHDFKNGITGIRFMKHQRCYIRTQTKELPEPSEVEAEDSAILVDDTLDPQVDDPQVWIPAEEPVKNRTFLLTSKIWDICRHLPIHWIHPLSMTDVEFHDTEETEEDQESINEEIRAHRQTRDVLDQQPVNDYRDAGLELDNQLDEGGYCCQHCRRGYRHCQRYHEPLRGYWPYPYYYQGGRVICQIIMPCNWWISRMLGRI
ncbi:tenomodulin [Megalops cyprinoides]|uniref:tenomodulin n=1 Tax=Megalops cyprinoides TaxID=118141 RepID=UPI0018640ECC|nr:tenomodulin [Megalops cyprinoides]